jgi:hypothetical protein
MDTVKEYVTDQELGQKIRELWEVTGQGIYLAPLDDSDTLRIALFSDLPDQETFYLVDELKIASVPMT